MSPMPEKMLVGHEHAGAVFVAQTSVALVVFLAQGFRPPVGTWGRSSPCGTEDRPRRGPRGFQFLEREVVLHGSVQGDVQRVGNESLGQHGHDHSLDLDVSGLEAEDGAEHVLGRGQGSLLGHPVGLGARELGLDLKLFVGQPGSPGDQTSCMPERRLMLSSTGWRISAFRARMV